MQKFRKIEMEEIKMEEYHYAKGMNQTYFKKEKDNKTKCSD